MRGSSACEGKQSFGGALNSMTNPFFEITPEEIALLADDALRDLVGMLCETEYRRLSQDTSCIRWGGHQDAADGGFDVVIRGGKGLPSPLYLARANVGFQVKKPSMPPSKIKPEMTKDGALKPAIEELAKQGGTYIIVSSGDDCSDAALKKRIQAMKGVVSSSKHSGGLALDFIDRSRLATWVRDHPYMVLWVKNRVGKTHKGWQPFGAWARIPPGGKDTYLEDDQLRVFQSGSYQSDGQSAIEAINQLRAQIGLPGSSTRIAGLSGVGKTRFVQALFEAEVGEQPIDADRVFYADVANSPEPDPVSLITQMVQLQVRTIFVLDNCPPELHRQATEAANAADSTVSVITVEYDVREDIPAETNVLRLEPASNELIEKMVRMHHPHISAVDAQTIAAFSDGNARVADALASTVNIGETLSGLKDEELFKRLFDQRQGSDNELQASAELLSLVYSFDGEDITSGSELDILATIAQNTPRKLYTDSATLADRFLVQSRSKWRAILPHALANRLAASGLKKYPRQVVQDAFVYSGNERLIRSFSRRLGYLHDSPQAQSIVRDWLKPNGWIGGTIPSLNDFGLSVLKNIAPVLPDVTLSAIEAALACSNAHDLTMPTSRVADTLVGLVRSIAYDPALFERACDVLMQFALHEEDAGGVTGSLSELFRVTLSGTVSSPENRCAYLQKLLRDQNPRIQKKALALVSASLEATHFSSSHSFNFGARPRGFGYRPRTQSDVSAWFKQYLEVVCDTAINNQNLKQEARTVIASSLRGLWWRAGIYDEIETAILRLNADEPWGEGWIAIRQIMKFDGSREKDPSGWQRLTELETAMRPQSLLEKSRTYAMGDANYDLELLDEDDEDYSIPGYQRADQITRDLGALAAGDMDTLEQLIPELVSSNGRRIGLFGQGLASGASDLGVLWDKLANAARAEPAETRNPSILMGFLEGYAKQAPSSVDVILDGIIEDPDFAQYFVKFQIAVGIDTKALPRLIRSLATKIAPINDYFLIGWGRAHDGFSDAELIQFFDQLEKEENGIEVVGDILKMRLFELDVGGATQELTQYIQRFLEIVPLRRSRRSEALHDHDLKTIVQHALQGDDADQVAQKLCDKLLESDRAGEMYLWQFPATLSVVAEKLPEVFLDSFFDSEERRNRPIFNDWFENRENPMEHIPLDDLVSWCQKDPLTRSPRIAREMVFFRGTKDAESLEWKTDLFNSLLDVSPNINDFLEAVSDTLRPNSWNGDRSDVLQTRHDLVATLWSHPSKSVQDWVPRTLARLEIEIQYDQEREKKWRAERDERFE